MKNDNTKLVGDIMEKEDIFKPGVSKLLDLEQGIFGPTSFLDYLKENNLSSKRNTPEYISIDSYQQLPPILKDNQIMALRLGSKKDNPTRTQFALVKTKNKLNDFFIFDSEIINRQKGENYLPSASLKKLYSYFILPKFSETSFVNLALASGILFQSLGISEKDDPLPPATGRSTFSFELYAHSDIKDKKLLHENGQVEIDAMFVGKRDGIETLFIVEAKSGNRLKSLSKHKLVYPILSVANKVPPYMPIVPIYLKIIQDVGSIHFHIVECIFPDPREATRALDELKIKKYNHYILPMNF